MSFEKPRVGVDSTTLDKYHPPNKFVRVLLLNSQNPAEI